MEKIELEGGKLLAGELRQGDLVLHENDPQRPQMPTYRWRIVADVAVWQSEGNVTVTFLDDEGDVDLMPNSVRTVLRGVNL